MSPSRRRLLLHLALLPALSPATALAKALYSYRDENGVLHFSDSPPNTEQDVTVRRLAVSGPEKLLQVHQRGARSEPRFEVDNRYHGPVQVEFTLTVNENLISTPTLPLNLVAPADSNITAFRLRPANPAQAWRYAYRYRWTRGDPAAHHRPRQPYDLPYSSGRQFPIAQAFGGPYSHHDAANHYAVDFAMPEGSPVHAARGGVVMEVAEDFFSGGPNRARYVHRANYVRLLHDDGSMAVYAHLLWESVRVAPGQRVRRGQPLAASGNTGYSTGPHLHFAIQLNRGLKLASVPFTFRSRTHDSVEPKAGMRLVAL